MEAAAQDLRAILANLSEGNAMAAPPTTGILPAGVDEVSAAITALFNTHGLAYQQLATAAEQFHQQFANLLSSARAAYEDTEIASGQMLRTAIDDMEQPFVPMLEAEGITTTPSLAAPPIPPGTNPIALVMGGTNWPLPDSKVMGVVGQYIPGLPACPLETPEQLWPGTPQLGSLTLNQSVALGVHNLNTALQTNLAEGRPTTVFGISQSCIVATDEIRSLMAQGSPGSNLLSFVLTADPNNPNGGFFERFTGAYIPVLDATFNGATPPNAPYQVSIYTGQYDFVADFPQYPLNVVSDLNALAGFAFVHTHTYVTPGQNWIQLPTSPGYTGNTTYYMALTQHLPLLDALRSLGTPGNTLADLLQPDLRVIVDMGYGSNEYANIPTPASLLEIPDPFTIVPDLAKGVVQGIDAAGVDLHLLPHSIYPTTYPFMPELNPGLNFPLPQTSATGCLIKK
jgi:hypothetical protein